MDKKRIEELAKEWNGELQEEAAGGPHYLEGIYIYVKNFIKWFDKKGYKIVKKDD